MGKAIPFFLGLLGALLGLGISILIIEVGRQGITIGSEYGELGLRLIYQGFGGLIFSLLGLIASTFVGSKKKLSGWLMIVAAFGGLLSIWMFFIFSFALLFLGGLVTLKSDDKTDFKVKAWEKNLIIGVVIILLIINVGFLLNFFNEVSYNHRVVASLDSQKQSGLITNDMVIEAVEKGDDSNAIELVKERKEMYEKAILQMRSASDFADEREKEWLYCMVIGMNYLNNYNTYLIESIKLRSEGKHNQSLESVKTANSFINKSVSAQVFIV